MNPLRSESAPLPLAQVGLGYWGPNLLRCLIAEDDCAVEICCDLDPDALDRFRKLYPNIRFTSEWQDVIRSCAEAVVIATPARSHYRLALEALEAEKHVMVEKPLATSSKECEHLIEVAEALNLRLMVGHTFLYSPPVKKLKEIVSSGELGELYYLYSRRLNLGRVRTDVNALWNLAPHDISILLHLLGAEPTSVSARGACYLQDGIEDVVFALLEFPHGTLATTHVSWLDPLKVRQLVVVGGNRMVVYDDVNSDAPIAVYDSGIDKAPKAKVSGLGEFKDYAEFQLLHRSGDVVLPRVKGEEPLRIQVQHFLECVRSGGEPITDGKNGLQVVRVLEAAQKSLKAGGTRVALR